MQQGREYALYMAHKQFSELAGLVEILAGNNIDSEKEEQILWLRVADKILDRRGIQEFYELIQMGDVDISAINKSDLSCQECFIANHALTASMILQSIVIPMIKDGD